MCSVDEDLPHSVYNSIYINTLGNMHANKNTSEIVWRTLLLPNRTQLNMKSMKRVIPSSFIS